MHTLNDSSGMLTVVDIRDRFNLSIYMDLYVWLLCMDQLTIMISRPTDMARISSFFKSFRGFSRNHQI